MELLKNAVNIAIEPGIGLAAGLHHMVMKFRFDLAISIM